MEARENELEEKMKFDDIREMVEGLEQGKHAKEKICALLSKINFGLRQMHTVTNKLPILTNLSGLEE
eukprot:12486637-Prorocentrum_lima.AAC.1